MPESLKGLFYVDKESVQEEMRDEKTYRSVKIAELKRKPGGWIKD